MADKLFNAHVQDFKSSLRVVISEQIDLFTRKTGITPAGISVMMTDTSTHTSTITTYTLVDVKINLGTY